MAKRFLLRSAVLFSVLVTFSILSASAQAPLKLEGVETWYWTYDTEISSVAVGDVDGDSSDEIITGGYYYDGMRDNAQLCVWKGSTLALENVTTWYWASYTYISSVVLGDVDGDASVEIVTGGYYWDGDRYNAQLCVWDGSALSLEDATAWYWTSDTRITSLATGDVDGDGSVEIVTGGTYFDDVRYTAQLCVWDGGSLTIEGIRTWYWTGDTYISSVAVADVDGDKSIEIVTGGYHDDSSRFNAQLCIWNGSALMPENVTTWYWISYTMILSVVLGDVDGDGSVEIVTGGYYNDGVRSNAQLCVWSGSTLALENVTSWYWTSHTLVNSLAVGDVDADGSAEIVTGGLYWDDVYENAQLCVWSGSMTLENVATWYWTSDTYISSATAADVDADSSIEIITGGYYYGSMSTNAQLCIWVNS